MTGISTLVKKERIELLLQVLGFATPGHVGVLIPRRIEGHGHRVEGARPSAANTISGASNSLGIKWAGVHPSASKTFSGLQRSRGAQ